VPGCGGDIRLGSERLRTVPRKTPLGGKACVPGTACSGPGDGALSSRAAHQPDNGCARAIDRPIPRPARVLRLHAASSCIEKV
jgi:hypothetical protein